jgi:hypothetical protein
VVEPLPYHLGPLTRKEALALPEELKVERRVHQSREHDRKRAGTPERRASHHAASLRHLELHREEINERLRDRYAADPEKHRGEALRWREANRERLREARRRWREANREKRRAYYHKWQGANPEKSREKSRIAQAKRRAADPEADNARTRKWREANPEKHRAAARKSKYGIPRSYAEKSV